MLATGSEAPRRATTERAAPGSRSGALIDPRSTELKPCRGRGLSPFPSLSHQLKLGETKRAELASVESPSMLALAYGELTLGASLPLSASAWGGAVNLSRSVCTPHRHRCTLGLPGRSSGSRRGRGDLEAGAGPLSMAARGLAGAATPAGFDGIGKLSGAARRGLGLRLGLGVSLSAAWAGRIEKPGPT